MKLRFNLTIGILFILAGLLVGSPHLIQQFEGHSAQPVAPATMSTAAATTANGSSTDATSTNVTAKSTYGGKPTFIRIPSVGIAIPVEAGYYNKADGTWTLSKTKAEFAAVTAAPNTTAGNTFIYGHNRSSVFKNLLKVKPGAKAYITTSDQHTYIYSLSTSRSTNPDDVSLFTYQGPPILTLQTCSGFWYQNRELFTFNFEQVT